MPQLKIMEAIFFHCNVIKNDYQHKSRVLYTFVAGKLLGQLLIFHLKILYF